MDPRRHGDGPATPRGRTRATPHAQVACRPVLADPNGRYRFADPGWMMRRCVSKPVLSSTSSSFAASVRLSRGTCEPKRPTAQCGGPARSPSSRPGRPTSQWCTGCPRPALPRRAAACATPSNSSLGGLPARPSGTGNPLSGPERPTSGVRRTGRRGSRSSTCRPASMREALAILSTAARPRRCRSRADPADDAVAGVAPTRPALAAGAAALYTVALLFAWRASRMEWGAAV